MGQLVLPSCKRLRNCSKTQCGCWYKVNSPSQGLGYLNKEADLKSDRLLCYMMYKLKRSWLHSGLQLLLQYVPRNSTDYFVNQLAIFEDHKGWDAADTKFSRNLSVLVDVHFRDDGFAIVITGQLLNNWSDHFTRTA